MCDGSPMQHPTVLRPGRGVTSRLICTGHSWRRRNTDRRSYGLSGSTVLSGGLTAEASPGLTESSLIRDMKWLEKVEVCSGEDLPPTQWSYKLGQ